MSIELPVMLSELKRFESLIASLNKRAKKLGVDPVKVSYGEKKLEVHFVNSVKYAIEYVPVVIDKPAIKLEGWVLLGALERIENDVILIGLKEHYRNVPSVRCDHCNIKHPRVKQFVVSKNGEEKVVGHSCLKDFLGFEIDLGPTTVWNFLAALDNLNGFEEEDSFSVGFDDQYVPSKIVGLASYFTKKYGYVRSSEEFSTKDYVLANYNDPLGEENGEDIIAEFNKYSESDDSEFAKNLRVLVSVDSIKSKFVGFLCFVPEYINRAKAKEVWKKEQSEKQESEFVGVVGERSEFELVVTKEFSFDGFYGTGYLFIMEDENNNVVVWKSNTKKLSSGDKVVLVARVKDQKDVPKYGKQTFITRPTIKEVIS